MVMWRTKLSRARLAIAGLLLLIGAAAGLFVVKKVVHHFRPRPLMMAGQDHSVVPAPNAFMEANPLLPALTAARGALERQPDVEPTGIDRAVYLQLIAGIVDHFSPLMGENGAISDPYEKTEIQYSTPSYALAAAVLVESGKRPDLLAKASKALDRSLNELATGSAANGTGDFFIFPAMQAYLKLRNRVDPDTHRRWEDLLRKIDPDRAYSDRIGPGQPDVMNWNSNAIAGEFLRSREGLADLAFVSRYLDAQLPRFTPAGLYRDPGLPLVYDAAARFNFLILLENGYDGPHRPALEVLLRRGAWASLLMQSPAGDFPGGGRSSGHVWNDALQCAMFEAWSRRSAAAGDRVGSRAFKRAARRAAQSVARWVRPGGDIWIVKNRFDPPLRHGYEDYSFHSQYNLLTAAYLALAWSYADDKIAEGADPAETGGFLVDLSSFHKIFANMGGHYLELDLAGEPGHGETGLVRDDYRTGIEGSGAPSVGGGTAIGMGWIAGGKVEYLATMPPDQIVGQLVSQNLSGRTLHFSVRYRLRNSAVKAVTETYALDAETVRVTVAVEGGIDRLLIRYPAFVTDGRSKAETIASPVSVTSRLGAWTRAFRLVSPADGLRDTGVTASDRSGTYKLFEAATDGHEASYALSQR
jgi:hypothetical protein